MAHTNPYGLYEYLQSPWFRERLKAAREAVELHEQIKAAVEEALGIDDGEPLKVKWGEPALPHLGNRPTLEVLDEAAPEHRQALADYIEKTKNDIGFFSEDGLK